MKSKEKVLRIVRYIISIFIYLIALGCFFNKWLLSGIILVLSGTTLLPILDDLLKFKHKRIIEVLATIILFIFGMAISPASKEKYNNDISGNEIVINNEVSNSTNEIVNETNNIESSNENINIKGKNEENNNEELNNVTSQSSATSNSNSNTQPKGQAQAQTHTQTHTQSQLKQSPAGQAKTKPVQTEKTQSKNKEATSTNVQKSTDPKTTSSQTSTSNETSSNINNSHGKIIYGTPTGKKYHYDPDCAGKNARVITNTKGLEPCKKCVIGH